MGGGKMGKKKKRGGGGNGVDDDDDDGMWGEVRREEKGARRNGEYTRDNQIIENDPPWKRIKKKTI